MNINNPRIPWQMSSIKNIRLREQHEHVLKSLDGLFPWNWYWQTRVNKSSPNVLAPFDQFRSRSRLFRFYKLDFRPFFRNRILFSARIEFWVCKLCANRIFWFHAFPIIELCRQVEREIKFSKVPGRKKIF